MSNFTRNDYQAVFNFAREQYHWHESTGRGFDLKAAILMEKCEEVIGQQSTFPVEARVRLKETPSNVKRKLWKTLGCAL